MFQEKVKNIISEGGYSCKQVLNCDEMPFIGAKMLSKICFSIKQKQAKGHNAWKDRFTLMPIINVTGHAVLRLLLVYPSGNSRGL